MKVLFLKNVLHVAKQGDIKEVKPGYAANCLFPQKFAVELTAEQEKQHKNSLKKEDLRRRGLVADRHEISEQLQ
jgi:ribosomal protein L9